MFQNLRITEKLVGAIVATLLVTSAIRFWITQRRVNEQAEEAFRDKVRQITSKLVKESADGAQQSAKACQDLSSLAMDMQQLVGSFRLWSGDTGRSPARRESGKHSRSVQVKDAARSATAAG